MSKNQISRTESGRYELVSKKRSTSDDFASYLVEYLNKIQPLFDKAKLVSEFEYACTLTGFKALQDPGWEPFDNTFEIFDSINILKGKIKDSFTKLNLFLWVYGHIIEASQTYELYANFLRIADNEAYTIDNFPDKPRGNHTVPQFPWEKIEKLKVLASKVNMDTVLEPLLDIFDRQLRNAIFHADYSIYNGEIRTYKIFSKPETYQILNKALAYFECWKILFNNAISEYSESKVVGLPARFSYRTGRIIVRKGYGLIGVKDNLTSSEISKINLPFHMGKFKYHEMEILRKDPTINEMPVDKTDKLHKIYTKVHNFAPKKLKPVLNKLYEKRLKVLQTKLINSTVANKGYSK